MPAVARRRIEYYIGHNDVEVGRILHEPAQICRAVEIGAFDLRSAREDALCRTPGGGYYLVDLGVGGTEAPGYGGVRAKHRLDALAQRRYHGNGGELPLGVGEQIALEEVAEQVLFQKLLDPGSKHGIRRLGGVGGDT